MKHFDLKFVRNFCLLVNLIIVGGIFSHVTAQTNVDFEPRFGNQLIRGDFSLIGNSNVELVEWATHNGDGVSFVDVDDDEQTANSSSARLRFSGENGADPFCTRVLFAGLYWSGRAQTTTGKVAGPNSEGAIDPERFDKNTVKLKIAGDNYQTITADHIVAEDGGPADVEANRGIYVAFADITDYVNTNKEGEYFVADIATTEGPDQSGVQIGYYGGWGLVVVYENPVMSPRNVVVFDGFRFVQQGGDPYNNQIDVDGFVAIDEGPVNVKLGVMAGEGDLLDEGDFLSIYNNSTGNYDRLSHNQNLENNFFNSTIFPDGERNPSLVDNAGTELAMFNVDNDSKRYVDNGDTQTSFRYGTIEDVFVIYNFTFAVDAFIPEVEAINSAVSGLPATGMVSAGDEVGFELVIKNRGNEAINDAVVTIPLPDFVDIAAVDVSDGTAVVDEDTGSLIWTIGDIEQPADPNEVLARLTYSLTVKDCEALIAAGQTCVPVVNVNGTLQGISATTDTPINAGFISGFAEPDVECVPEGNPIYDDITFSIDLSGCFEFTPGASTLCPGSTTTMIPLNTGGVWTSSDETIATVDENGMVTAVSPGEVEITYSATGDPDCEAKATQTITVRDDCQVASEKTVADGNGDDLAQAGETLIYTISVSNSYDRIMERTITDAIPDNTSLVEGSITGDGVYDEASNSIIWTSVSIPAADAVSVSFSVTVAEDLTEVPSVRNSAVVTGDDPDTPEEPEVEIPTDPVKSFESVKTADKATVGAGEELTYTITVTNTGDVDYDGITISDDVPANTIYKDGSASTGATLDGNTLTWTVDVPFGESREVSFTVVVVDDLTEVPSILNSAVVTGDDPDTPDEPEVEIPTDPVKSFESVKAADKATVGAGEELTYTITVTNTGDVDYDGITISDDVPAHTTYKDGSASTGATLDGNTLTWTVDVPFGESREVSFTVVVADDLTEVSSILNSAVVTGDDPDTPDEPEVEIPTDPVKSFESVKTADKATVGAGEELTYTITVTNTGDVDYDGITISDDVPANTTYKDGSASTGATLDGNTLTWTVDVPFGESREVSFTVVVADDLTEVLSILNSAVVTGDDPDTPDEPEVEIPTDPVKSFESVKTADKATVGAGEELTYTITVTNTGDVDYDGITISDDVPAHTTYKDGSASAGATVTDNTLTWTVDVPFGESREVSFTVVVADDLTEVPSILNSAVVTGDDPDTPDEPEVEIPTDPVKSFESVKTADKATVGAGEELTYTITVTNTGDVDYDGITISDDIPAHTTYKDGSASAGATVTDNTLTWTVDVPFGESREVSFTVVVADDLTEVPSILNSAVVTGDDPDIPEKPEVETPIKEEPPVDEGNRSFTATKSVLDETGDGKAEAGEELTFTITVANTGDENYEGITIEDSIPENTTYVAGSTTHGGSLNNGTLTWTINVPVGDEVAVSFKVTVVDDVTGKGAIRNVATVIGGTPEDPEKETPESPELPIIYGPEANDDHTSTNQGSPVTIDVSENDEAGSSPVVPGTVLLIEPGTGNKVTTVTIEGEGTYTVGADGGVTFTPDAEYVGNSAISYTVKDENGLESNDAVITVTVEGVAAEIAPTAVDDTQTAPYGEPVTIDVLRNDVDGSSPIVPTSVTLIDGSGNRTNAVTIPGEGRYEVNAQGTVTFVPVNGFTGTSTLKYEVTDENGLMSNPAVISVTVNERPFKIPNVFTPNGDGRNDVFEIVGIEGFDRVEITVVNRWGNEVYRNNNYRNDWDGQGLNEGTYYYVIITHDGSRQERYAGWVLIKRQ